ncbi:UNKNOWN [Stylonychia lemnae]|uniref:Uncharacterized protein n=1 Tax=Stylonychia lemnae TaxID=5949 RepID=A0A078AFI7_STYLE|nr:UNKNOWN [Stylonychia lemnae]|eukprot:CDW80601.1 UNKNOWN [Stylonychia lemnae]
MQSLYNGFLNYSRELFDASNSAQSSIIQVCDNIVPDPKLFTQLHPKGLAWMDENHGGSGTYTSQNKRKKQKGKLIKGFVLNQDYFQNRSSSLSENNPITHTTMPSINRSAQQERKIKGSFPAKFETLILKKESRNGFGSSVERFLDLNATLNSSNSQLIIKNSEKSEIPGPGTYIQDASLMAKDNAESMSRKGYGNGFVSKSKRFNLCFDKNSLDYVYAKLKATPGPGQYDFNLSTMNSRRPISSVSTQFSTPKRSRQPQLIPIDPNQSSLENINTMNIQVNDDSLMKQESTFLFDHQKSVQKKTRFRIPQVNKDISDTPGPSDYKIREMSSAKKYRGITIPKSHYNKMESEIEEKQNLAPGYYKVSDDSIKKRNIACKIRPPKPPKKQIQIIQQAIDEIQYPPVIQSSLNHLLKFDKIDFEALEIVDQRDYIGPGTFKTEEYNSIESEQINKNITGNEHNYYFVQPERNGNFRDKLVQKSIFNDNMAHLQNPGPGNYNVENYNTIKQSTKAEQLPAGTNQFKSDVIKGESFMLMLKNEKQGPGPAYYHPTEEKDAKNMNPLRKWL